MEIGQVHHDTSDFFKVEYGDVAILGEKAYLVRHDAKEGRFGLDDEVKHWVKRCIDLQDGSLKIVKLVFYEKFKATIATLSFDCFRSSKKEARILDLVADHKNFMHGYWVKDSAGNIVRIIDYIYGKTLHAFIQDLSMDHEAYYHEMFPDIFKQFFECVKAIEFLHRHREKHGDIRRDHIIIDRESGNYRWIDFDFNYMHRENMFGYDLFGLGNILIFLVGMGDVLLTDLNQNKPEVLDRLEEGDLNIVFNNRVANLQKVYPYLPESLNRVLLHIINEPEEDFFASVAERQDWLVQQRESAQAVLENCKQWLIEKGFAPDHVFTQVRIRYCPSIGECILNEAESSQAETIVVGRKGVSRKEEFLFGSVSNRIIHQAKDCTVWVVV